MNWRLRQIHAVRTKVFSLATLFGFFISRTSEVECFHLHQACGLCWFIQESRQTTNSNISWYILADIQSDVFLLQVLWYIQDSVQSFLQTRMCESWMLICRISAVSWFRFSISQSFELRMLIRFNSTSHCSVHIKRGNWFHWTCISWMFFCESAYSVILFDVSVVYIVGSELFNAHHNHAIWWTLKRFCQAFLQVFVCQISRFFT